MYGTFMMPLSWRGLWPILPAAAAFALILDPIKRPVMSVFKIR